MARHRSPLKSELLTLDVDCRGWYAVFQHSVLVSLRLCVRSYLRIINGIHARETLVEIHMKVYMYMVVCMRIRAALF